MGDSFRSFFLIAVMFGLMWFYLKKSITAQVTTIAMTILILFDLWPIDQRYLNKDNFTDKKEVEVPFQPTDADLRIKADPDPHYRVYNTAMRPDQDSRTSYFHKSLGGYHGAKLRRYQELIDHHISKGNINVINMLNTKYSLGQNKEGVTIAQRNPGNLGNAWFVDTYRYVASPDSEITALSNFDPSTIAIVDQRFKDVLGDLKPSRSPGDSIALTSYAPNHLQYNSTAAADQLAVFSEIYYKEGWNAYVDGELTPHIRVNYVLRAMHVPAGNHKIEFKFEPSLYPIGEAISLTSSGILVLLLAGYLLKYFREQNVEVVEDDTPAS